MGLIYLIRHGQTEWNKEEIFRGQRDIPLDAMGRSQAHALGLELKHRGLNDPVFISSPLQRAFETATIAAAVLGAGSPVQAQEAFTDMHFGAWEGISAKEIASLYPELYRLWQENPADVVFPRGEGLPQVADRAVAALQAVALTHLKRDVVVVSHRVVNKLLLCYFMGSGPASFWKIWQDTACLNVLSWDGHSFSVLLVNDTCHLRPLAEREGKWGEGRKDF